MNEQDSESLDSLRESSAFELAIKAAESTVEVLGILHAHGLSEEAFTNRFPVLAKVAQGLPNVPDEAAPPA
ncbi:hypothetical protein [Streptomyces kronopolitis]|uniref:hypothetical protein n=1 Tax=Streptomyces kronopolitis TaxID=1612435 RepID=UPI0020C09301|nr:hypothetical protein [Streptomyces kronopolitis]MCL6299690.1 hypothetical protein [Streptomyces kronopolitis]